ncbi:MAG: hypothetical protein ABI671_08480 [Burkholderiales bacterium]
MPDYDLLGFSEGLRMRARLEGWPAFFALAAKYLTNGEMTALESEERDWHANDPELIRSAERDQTALVESFRPDDDALEQALEVPLVRKIRIAPDRSANAAVCWLDDDSQRIDLNVGLGLAIEDAVLSACCARGFATEREAASDLPPAFPMLLVGAEGSFRYHDYAVPWHRRLRRQRSLFVRQLPVDPARMAIADLLKALSFRWVMLHEQAHWLAGHLDYLRVSRRVGSLALSETRLAATGVLGPFESLDHCMELQADSLATQLFLTFGLADDWLERSPHAKAYMDRMDRCDPDHRSASPDVRERLPRLRMMLLAAGIGCLLFEVRRQHLAPRPRSHPSPSARLINVCATVLSTYGDIVHFEADENVDDDTYNVQRLRPALVEMTNVLADLQIFAGVVGLRDENFRAAITRPRTGASPSLAAMSPLAMDVFSLLSANSGGTGYGTPGGLEFEALGPAGRELWTALAPYSRMGAWRPDEETP